MNGEVEDCTTIHIVVEGDTCNDIVKAAETDLETLYANNRQIDGEYGNIYPGEVRLWLAT